MRRKKVLLLACIIFSCGKAAWSEVIPPIQFLELSLEDQVHWFFSYYKDGHTYISVTRYAGYIVHTYGDAVIPYLKEYLKDADYFSSNINPPQENNPDFYKGEPNDITLTLIACVWSRLHIYDNYVFSDTTPLYILDEGEIQWFVNEYKRRIDEYIMAKRVIDETVLSSEIDIIFIVGYDGNAESITKYGHPYYDEPVKFRGNEIKEYYEKRLGITGLKVVPPFTEGTGCK
jgi:hypothetical protein